MPWRTSKFSAKLSTSVSLKVAASAPADRKQAAAVAKRTTIVNCSPSTLSLKTQSQVRSEQSNSLRTG